MGWIGFCEAALPSQRTEITVVDYLGYTWKLVMDFCHDDVVSCIFTGEWQALAEAQKFTPRQIIRLGVTGEANNRVMYLCAPPILTLKTKIQASAAAGHGGVTYRVHEYFWTN